MSYLTVLLIILISSYGVICHESYKGRIFSDLNSEPFSRSVYEHGLKTSSPTCSDISRVANVFFPTGNDTNCNAVDGKISPQTIWWGFPVGLCMGDVVCLGNYTVSEACASKGLTLDGYNACYQESDSCIGPLGWLKVSYADPNYFIMEFHSSSYCNDTLPNQRNISYQCGSFGWGMRHAGYDTASYVYLDKCSTSTTSVTSATSVAPESSSASILSLFIW